MTGKRGPSDARLNALRYRIDHRTPGDEQREQTAANDPAADTGGTQGPAAKEPTLEQRAQYVEVAIQQAMRRGDFDNLPGAGKPLTNLHEAYDPDWWIRRKIEREKISGLGPPALTLRTENAALDARLDAVHSEAEVREILGDFNRRVIEARRQLQGGPPVVTPTREIDEEVRGWRERRDARHREREAERMRREAEFAAMSRRERRRARRAR